MPSVLEQYRVADFIEWHEQRRLELNPNFQRGSVWTPPAKSFLIDTVLRQLPIPKVFLRTRIDVATRNSIREVVDGQQRLRAILDFANDKFALSKRAGEYAGLKYSDLGDDDKEKFLGYSIAVDQLVNANDEAVLEVFARLNSYSVALNPAEKRHAYFQGEFKWAVRDASHRWSILWEPYGVISVRDRVRMLDDSLVAEMFGILLEGVRDGGQPKIDALYKKYDSDALVNDNLVAKLDDVISYFVGHLADFLVGSPVMRAPHFLMLFAALAHVRWGIPDGDIGQMPAAPVGALTNLDVVRANLQMLGAYIEGDNYPGPFEAFHLASASSTQRISSRKVRFPIFVKALGNALI